MKRLFTLLLTLSLMVAAFPALAAGADIRADLPEDIHAFFSSSTFNGYTIHMEAVEVFEDTVGGSFAFAAATKGNQHTLYGFVKKDGKWQYWLKNTTVLLNTEKSYILANCKGQTDIDTEQIYKNDSLQIILLSDTGDYYVHSQIFSVNEYGQWHMKSIFSHLLAEKTVTNAWVEKDRIIYYREDLARNTTVWGVVETNLRYCSIAAFPPTVQAAREVLTNPPSIPGSSQLTAKAINFTGGQKFPVYSGPGSSYERAAGGKAMVSTNDWIQVFGEENGYILIQYDISADQMRFGYIEKNALPKGADIPQLTFDFDEAVITQNTYLTDDPLNSQTLIRSISAGQSDVKWLATMGNWVYAEVQGSGESLRGFIPAHAITRTPGRKTYTASYNNSEYTASVQADITYGTLINAQISVTAPASWNYDASADPITGYQLYANNVPVACQSSAAKLSLSSSWHTTFTLSGTLPQNTAILGLCPIRASGQNAAETIILSLNP
ncbi:MAG: hypothetical protein IJD39_00365 [Clostridia bacterium]|nr:hypothetical protein [Clostridia bacterium]